MKVLVATEKPFAKVAVDGIRKEVEAAGYELALLEKYTEKAQLLEAVKDANAIIIRSDVIDNEVFDAAPELKIVVRAGAGYDNVDLEAATAHGVCVMNTPGQNSNAVAELAFGMMIMAVRNFYDGKSGTDMDMVAHGFLHTLEASLKEKAVTQERIDEACRRVLEAKYKLGLFENPYKYCDTLRGRKELFTEANRKAAREIAAETFVLLKNEGKLLPLQKKGRIALIGPMADAQNNMCGTWNMDCQPSSSRENAPTKPRFLLPVGTVLGRSVK